MRHAGWSLAAPATSWHSTCSNSDMREIGITGLMVLLLLAAPADALIVKDPDASARLAARSKAIAALDAFSIAFRAKGKKGAAKTWAQSDALQELAKVAHPLIADKLLRIATNSGTEEIRTSALFALGSMKDMPAYAGEHLSRALEKRKIRKDSTSVLTVIERLQLLPFVPSERVWKKLLKHPDVSVQKSSIAAIAKLGDVRMMDALVSIWAESDRAEARSRSGGAQGNGALSGGRGRRLLGKTKLRPAVSKAVEDLTGEEFERAAEVREWLGTSPERLQQLVVKLDEALAKQVTLLKETQAWARAKK